MYFMGIQITYIKSNHISNWNKLIQTTPTHTWNKQFAQDGNDSVLPFMRVDCAHFFFFLRNVT